MFRSKTYTCRACGFVFAKQTAIVSGFDDDLYGKHVHCARCGAIVAERLNQNNRIKSNLTPLISL